LQVSLFPRRICGLLDLSRRAGPPGTALRNAAKSEH
jgi:hypothetical protein